MERLPNELWQQICDFSNTKTLKTLRLVHPILNDLAARVLFETIYVAIFEYFLQNLSRIALHPVLRFYVHKIMFLNQVLDDKYRDYQSWLWMIDLRAHSNTAWKIEDRVRGMLFDAHYHVTDIRISDDVVLNVDLRSDEMITVSKEDVADRYVRYNKLRHEQYYLLPQTELDFEREDLSPERGVTLKTRRLSVFDYIAHAVTSLANLRAVETFEERRQVDRTHGAARDSHEGMPLSFLSRLQQETLLKDPFRDSRFSHHICNTTVTSLPIMVLLKALTWLDKRSFSNSGIPKIDLTINALPWSFWMQGFDSLLARDHKPFMTVLSCIRSLDLDSCIGFDGDFRHVNAANNQMTEFLKGLENLEHLALRFHVSEHQKYPNLMVPWRAGVPLYDVSEVFRQIPFQRLSTLSIADYAFNEEVFVAFMQRHSKQLKCLRAMGLNMVGEGSSWRSAIERIAPVMSLDVADLRCLLDDGITAVMDCADKFKSLIEYDKMASLYLELNGNVEYPSSTALVHEL